MRTIRTITIVAMMLVSVLGYAEKRTVIKKAEFNFDNVKIGQLLNIKDEKGRTIYSEIIKTNGNISKTIEIDMFEDGLYSVELEKDFEVLVKPFEIENQTYITDDSQAYKFFKPVVKNDGNTLKVSQLSPEATSVKIEIYYADELIYSETVKNENIVNRVFKLSTRAKGEYQVVIKEAQNVHVNHFKI